MMDDIKKDIDVIEEECEKIKCEPIFNIINTVYKLICDLLSIFKTKPN
jgi:hypothetical protein